jgi:ribonuclease HII
MATDEVTLAETTAPRCTARLEKRLQREGFPLVAGVDEVGRGALAGPVMAAAVILDLRRFPRGINDSKLLTKAARERLSGAIQRRCIAFAAARVDHKEVDRLNIHQASLRAMAEAVKALQPPPDYVLIDGRHLLPNLACPQRAIIKGDKQSVSIAAASILAKVARDRIMTELDALYPGYGFASHVGYNTREHQEAIARLGASAIHRLTFRGVLSYQPRLDFGS